MLHEFRENSQLAVTSFIFVPLRIVSFPSLSDSKYSAVSTIFPSKFESMKFVQNQNNIFYLDDQNLIVEFRQIC